MRDCHGSVDDGKSKQRHVRFEFAGDHRRFQHIVPDVDEVGCFKCHSGDNLQDEVVFFTSNFDFDGRDVPHVQFDNTGLYNLDQDGSYPEPNTGVFRLTGDPQDMGKFKVPTLRNVAITWPYFHDASAETLEDAVRTMAKYQLGRNLTDTEADHLVQFLHTLTGTYQGVTLSTMTAGDTGEK